MKKVLLSLAVLFVFATAARASVLSLLEVCRLNKIEDTDFEVAIDAGNSITDTPSTTLDIGDFLVGMYSAQELEIPPGVVKKTFVEGDPTFSAVFAVKVTGKTALGGGLFDFTFTNASDAEWGTLGLKALGFDPDVDGTAVMVYDDPNDIDATIPDDDADTSIDDSIVTVNGTLLWEFGFDGDPDLYWYGSGLPADLTALSQVTSTGAVNIGLNMTKQHAGMPLGPIAIDPLLDPDTTTGDGKVDLIGFDGVAGAPDAVHDWQAITDEDFLLHPVPEPASWLVWAGLVGLVAFYYRRWRK
jgi:hypothetical protein